MNHTAPRPFISPAYSALPHPHNARQLRHVAMCVTQCLCTRPNTAPHTLPAPLAPATTNLVQRAWHAQRRQRRSGGRAAAASVSAPGSPSDPTAENTAADGDTDEAAPQVLAGRTVAVIGGGPGGMLCAAHLARLGAAVDVFESRDPAAVDRALAPPPVWSIFLGPNAIKSIKAAGLSPDFGPQWKFEGGAQHAIDKPTVFRGEWAAKQKPEGMSVKSPQNVLATQYGIVDHLQAECGRVYGDAVRVHDGMRAVGGDVCAGEVVLQDPTGERGARSFDLVVGADGVRSTVRQLMQQQDKQLEAKVEESAVGMVVNRVTSPGHPATFATLDTPSGQPFEGVPEGYEGAADGCCFHSVSPSPAAPPAFGVCAVSVRRGGAEVVLNISTDKKVVSKMRSAEEVEAQLVAAFPQLPKLWLRETAQMIQDEALDEGLRLRSPTFVTCSKLASGRAVLLGDAAHAVSPNVGLGCASALQDSEVLSRACIAAGGVISAAAQQYNTMRIGNAHTLTHISRRIDATQGFRYHRNPVKALVGLPYFVAQAVANMSDKRVPAFLRPGFSIRDSFTELDDWTGLKAKVRWYGARLAAIFLAAAAAAAAAACKLFALLRTVQL